MRLPSDAHARQTARVYEAAQRDLERLIGDAVDRGAKGTARYYKNQLAEVHAVLTRANQRGLVLAGESVAQSYVSGALIAERTLGINGTFGGVHTEAVQVLIDNAVTPMHEATAFVGRRVDDLFRKLANHDVTLGIIEGATRKDVSAAFRRNLVKQGVTSFVDAGGRQWGLASYTRMVARTTTREAVSHGTANRMLENGHDLVTISEHASEDDICTDYAGVTFSLTGDTEGYDKLDTYPPFHPNCVHVLTPAAETFKRFERAVAADAATEKPTMMVSANG